MIIGIIIISLILGMVFALWLQRVAASTTEVKKARLSYFQQQAVGHFELVYHERGGDKIVFQQSLDNLNQLPDRVSTAMDYLTAPNLLGEQSQITNDQLIAVTGELIRQNTKVLSERFVNLHKNCVAPIYEWGDARSQFEQGMVPGDRETDVVGTIDNLAFQILRSLVGVGDEIVGRFGNLADQVGHDPTFVNRYRELTTEKGIKIGLHVVVRDLDPNDHIKVTYYMALAVKNIIANAHKYCYRDGWGFISMKMDFSTRGLTVIIHNNGDGIPQCVVEGLFKGALQSQSGGLGIGMHRVYEGLRKVGGDIILSRNVRNPTDKNHGVTFEMKVPITKIAQ